VERLAEQTRGKKLRDVRTGQSLDLDLPVGTLLVRLDQPSARLARVLLDPHVPMAAEFLREEREYLEKGKGTRLYETTAWALPLALGVPAYWSGSFPGGEWRALGDEPGSEHSSVPDDFSALLVDGDPDRSQPFLAAALQAGLRIKVAEKPFKFSGQAFAAGSLLITREQNPHHLASRLQPLLEEHGVQAVPVSTSRVEEGSDLGGADFQTLVEPRVAMLGGMPIAPTHFGTAWHLLDQDLGLRYSNLDISNLGRVDLSRYNVLIFPPVMGGPASYRQTIGPGGMENLRQWVQAGGTAIGWHGGAGMLADLKTELTRTRMRDQAVALHPSPVWSISALEAEQAGRAQATGMRLAAPSSQETAEASALPEHGSLYDVAPVLGPGVLPFVEGTPVGTALRTRPVPMAKWLQGVLPAGKPAPLEEDLILADQRLRRFMPRGLSCG
jgi:hypothetical protein